jgi:hypothetical protein
MIKYLIVVFFACVALFICYNVQLVKSKTSGAHPGATGAPNEPTCAKAGCHSDAVVAHLNSGGVSKLTYSGIGNTYMPDSIYHFNLAAERVGHSKFGFEVTTLEDALFTYTGQLALTDLPRTQIINNNISGVIRKYITHTAAGTTELTPGKTSWNFDWIAPSTNVGPISFYYAINVTNNNNLEFGDSIYLGRVTLQPFQSPNAVSTCTDINFKAYSYANQIFLKSYNGSPISNVVLFDLDGKEINANTMYIDNNNAVVTIQNWKPTIVILSFTGNNKTKSIKIMTN